MIMIILYIILFVILAAITFKSFGQYSSNIFCFGAPILGFAIMVLNFLNYDISTKFLVIFGIAAIVGLVLWIVIARYRCEEQNSTYTSNALVGGITSRLA